MDDWKKFNETSLPEKEDFYINLNMKDITDADYAHEKKVCKNFRVKNLGEYHDLYVPSDTLLLTDVFKNFRKMCLKMYELDPTRFPTAPCLAWLAALKKTKVKLDLLTDIDMLLTVKKAIRREICHAIHRYAKVSNKYMKDYFKNKESSSLKYWDLNNLYGWAISQKLSVNNFKWVEEFLNLMKGLQKIIMKKVMKDIFLKMTFNILKIYLTCT